MKLSNMKGKSFNCVKEYKGNSIEDIPRIREALTKQVRSYNLNEKDVTKHTKLIETDTKFQFSNSNQYVIKPKINKFTKGIIEFRKGGDYIFHYDNKKSYGVKLKASMLNNNILSINDQLVYTIDL